MDGIGRSDASKGPRIVGPRDGASVDLGAISARFMVWGEESGGGFALVEHPIPPRTLAAPIHRHSREDDMDRAQDLCEVHGLRFPPLMM